MSTPTPTPPKSRRKAALRPLIIGLAAIVAGIGWATLPSGWGEVWEAISKDPKSAAIIALFAAGFTSVLYSLVVQRHRNETEDLREGCARNHTPKDPPASPQELARKRAIKSGLDAIRVAAAELHRHVGMNYPGAGHHPQHFGDLRTAQHALVAPGRKTPPEYARLLSLIDQAAWWVEGLLVQWKRHHQPQGERGPAVDAVAALAEAAKHRDALIGEIDSIEDRLGVRGLRA